MTSEEIKELSESGRTEVGWLKEIAYQLACLNERQQQESKPSVVVKRK